MKKLMRATMVVLTMGCVAAPWTSAQACMIRGGSNTECIEACYKVRNFWEQILCSLGAAPAPRPDREAKR